MNRQKDERSSGSTEEQFKKRLLELGLLTEISPPLRGAAIPVDRQPVPVEGNPISDLIVRERLGVEPTS